MAPFNENSYLVSETFHLVLTRFTNEPPVLSETDHFPWFQYHIGSVWPW